ncbi:hypothetical protein GCM10022235_82950 [Kribbella ginsengisoli]|uniref:Bifunctional DNA primase/polymerase-like protein n=1 Tax=Kribbella ginsengisoli TaxID=363865 RepID=A0ABP6Z5B5_9ACTN
MFKARHRLLATAFAYAEQGIAVRQAYSVIRTASALDAFGRWRCACGDLTCQRPGTHASGDDWLTDIADVARVWSTPQSPNLLATSGAAVWFWKLPRVIGAYGMRLFEQQRPGPWPPLLKLPSGDWVVATARPVAGVTLATGVSAFQPGTPVLMPPSRLPSGRTRWLQSPAFPQTPLPSAESVHELVQQAERERFELLGYVG